MSNSPATKARVSAPATGGLPPQPISLSTATVEQLDTLDGIGPTLAARIVAYRTAHGGFRSIDELKHARFVRIPGAGHLSMLVAPQAVAAAIAGEARSIVR